MRPGTAMRSPLNTSLPPRLVSRHDRALPMGRRIEIVEAKVAELTGLGASVESRTRYDDPGDPVYFVVMHDPEGNEFCVG